MPRSVAKGYINSNQNLQKALESIYKRLHVFQEVDPIFVGPSLSKLSVFVGPLNDLVKPEGCYLNGTKAEDTIALPEFPSHCERGP